MRDGIIKTPRFRMSRGLSLLEVLVTIAITSIGLMGLISLQMQAVRATNDSGNRSQAIWIFNDIINRIHANEANSNSYINDLPVACDRPKVCSRFHSGSGIVEAADCSGPELADWDRYEVACELRPLPYIGDASRYLPESKLTITCTNAPCSNGDPLTITLEWRAKVNDEEITGAVRDANSGLLTLTDVITP